MIEPVCGEPTIAEVDYTEPLRPTMKMLLQFGKIVSPPAVHDALVERAKYFQTFYRNAELFKAESWFMRTLQDGLNFGKWPA